MFFSDQTKPNTPDLTGHHPSYRANNSFASEGRWTLAVSSSPCCTSPKTDQEKPPSHNERNKKCANFLLPKLRWTESPNYATENGVLCVPSRLAFGVAGRREDAVVGWTWTSGLNRIEQNAGGEDVGSRFWVA